RRRPRAPARLRPRSKDQVGRDLRRDVRLVAAEVLRPHVVESGGERQPLQGLSASLQPEMMVGGERQLSAGPYGLGAVWSPWSREHEIPPERSASVGVTRLDVEGPALQAQYHLEPRPSRLSHVLEVHPRRSGSDHAVDIVAQIGSECSEGGGEAAEWRPA